MVLWRTVWLQKLQKNLRHQACLVRWKKSDFRDLIGDAQAKTTGAPPVQEAAVEEICLEEAVAETPNLIDVKGTAVEEACVEEMS